jgi:hypothetical protein
LARELRGLSVDALGKARTSSSDVANLGAWHL